VWLIIIDLSQEHTASIFREQFYPGEEIIFFQNISNYIIILLLYLNIKP
jgi:hypothetical protein